MKWGAPTWTLLHTLAEKIGDAEMNNLTFRTDFLNLIFSICTNLPCPSCAEHAKQTLNKLNYRAIRTRRDLKTMLFEFHNAVNARKGYRQFTREELDEKYARGNLPEIIYTFFHFYKDKTRNQRYLATEMFRDRVIQRMQEWFVENQTRFLP
jgi:hypothetical protein